MLVPTMHVVEEYKPLLVKLKTDATMRKPKKLVVTCEQYSELRDVQIIVSLACIMPILTKAN
jgi:hypothetical protein